MASRWTRPSTPSMMLGPLGGPNSPPHSPTSAAPPMLHHKYAARHLPPSGIQPTGNGHQFSFTPSNRFAQLSPRTSSEDSDEEESESESDSDESELPQAPQPNSEDEEDDSDDEESEDDSDDDADDEDEDVPMMAPPPPPPPALMSAPMRAPIRAPSRPPMPQSMAVDSSSEGESDDEEDAEDEEGDDEESEEDSESSDSDSEMLPHAPEAPPIPRPAPAAVATAAITVATSAPNVKANFTVEEMSDFDPMDQDRDGIMAPSGYSSPASARSRSRAPVAPPKPDPTYRLAREFDHLNFPSSDSESEDLDADEAHEEFIRVQRTLRMLRRRTHGSSIGKRTISERSESDHEDMPLDPEAVGSSARRLRRRVGDQSVRRSFILQFQDPPPPRIDELDEPDSEVEGIFFCDHETLARELPYYSLEIIEYESPSPTSPRSP